LQRRLFEKYRIIRYLHLARDVQIMARVRLREIPAVFGQGRERGHGEEEQRQQRASGKKHEALPRV
jgi:hypothetical protein